MVAVNPPKAWAASLGYGLRVVAHTDLEMGAERSAWCPMRYKEGELEDVY